MELESVHDAYKKELERVCEKHQIELDETEQRHRNEIQKLCAENSLEISNIKQTMKSLYDNELENIRNKHGHEICELKEQFERRLDDLKDCDLDTLTKRIEDDISKTHTKHKKIVSYLVNEIYKLKKVIYNVIVLYVIKVFYSFNFNFQTLINSPSDEVDRLSSLESFDPKLFRSNSNDHDTDVETSDYVCFSKDLLYNVKSVV